MVTISKKTQLNKKPSFSQKRKRHANTKKIKKVESSGKHEVVSITPPQEILVDLLEKYQAGNLHEAIASAKEISENYPDHPFSWKVLGAILKQKGKISEALVATKRCTELAPDNAESHNNLGTIQQELGMLEIAEASYKKAITLNARFAMAYNNLGLVQREIGKLEVAEESFLQSLAIQPAYFDAYNNLGSVQKQLGKLAEAEESYKRAIKIKPNIATTHNNLGYILQAQRKQEEAEASYKRAIALNCNFPEAHNNLGLLFQNQGKLQEAHDHFNKVIMLEPKNVIAHLNLGILHRDMGQLEKSQTRLKLAKELKPDDPIIFNNLGITLFDQNKLNEAKVCYETALSLNPSCSPAYMNLAIYFKRIKQFKNARSYFKKSLEADPNFIDAKVGMSWIDLTLKNFRRGFELFENRHHKSRSYRVTPLPKIFSPQYTGTNLNRDLKGKHLLILPEQGIGDEVMFSSVLHELESLKKNSLQIKITLVCDKRLVDLYNRSFKFLTAIPKDPEHSYHHLDNEIDYWIFNGSLPKFFRLTCEDFDAPIPYLRANENCYKEWKKRYSLLNHTINIGISWRGGLAAKSRADRSLDLDQLLPVLTKASQNANLINLQYGEHTSEIEEFTKRSGIPIHDWEDSNPLKDVESFIAQIKALDLVLTIDNSTAHFAGALGKKTHLMLPFDQDWRWGEESTNSYWYSKNLTLFRQKSLGNWSTVIQSIREALD